MYTASRVVSRSGLAMYTVAPSARLNQWRSADNHNGLMYLAASNRPPPAPSTSLSCLSTSSDVHATCYLYTNQTHGSHSRRGSRISQGQVSKPSERGTGGQAPIPPCGVGSGEGDVPSSEKFWFFYIKIFFRNGTLNKRAGVRTPWTPPGSAPAQQDSITRLTP